MPKNQQRLNVWVEASKTTFRKWLRISDVNKWQNPANLSEDWDIRTQQIAALIQPGQSVLEFGAGRMSLKNYLPEGCTYTPSDLMDRGEGTIVCDLNANVLPDFPTHDVIVFGGVLEYVHDVPRLIAHIAQFTNTVITSYVSLEYFPKILDRRSLGWVHDYSSKELVEIFEKAGFACQEIQYFYPKQPSSPKKRKKHPSQEIYKFMISKEV